MTEKLTTVARRLGELMRDEIAAAAPEGPFGRLKKSFQVRVLPTKPVRVVVYSIYYWAKIVNDGRKAISGNKQMLFYLDPADDPRIEDDYPRAKRLRRRLTKEEVRTGLEEGTLIRTFSVGGVSATRFINKGIERGRPKASKAMQQFLKASIRDVLKRQRSPGNVTKTKITAVFGR